MSHRVLARSVPLTFWACVSRILLQLKHVEPPHSFPVSAELQNVLGASVDCAVSPVRFVSISRTESTASIRTKVQANFLAWGPYRKKIWTGIISFSRLQLHRYKQIKICSDFQNGNSLSFITVVNLLLPEVDVCLEVHNCKQMKLDK